MRRLKVPNCQDFLVQRGITCNDNFGKKTPICIALPGGGGGGGDNLYALPLPHTMNE